MPTALAISPHLDDAAFSCGGALARLAARGWRVVLCTVFTASVEDPTGFALACQFDKGLTVDVDYMALRRAEDARAAEALGLAPPLWLPFAEAPHRGYHSANALFAAVRSGDRIDESASEALRGVIAEERPDLLVAPQAIGGHVDHVQVVRALQRLSPPIPVMHWQDFPYLIRTARPPEPFREDMAALAAVEVRLDPATLARKRTACRAYASQLGFQFGGVQGLDRVLSDTETFRAAGAPPRDLLAQADIDAG